MPYIIAAFYHFFDFPDYSSHRQPLLARMKELGIKGSLLIAPEGLNGTLAGTRDAIDRYLAHVQTEITKAPLDHKESLCDRQPFGRAKVRLKKEVISLGVPTPSLSLPRKREREQAYPLAPKEGGSGRGTYVTPREWNALIADPGVTVIDARNHYEIHLGTFKRAIDPRTRNFKQLPDFVRHTLDPAKHTKIATFCTGGIRCEKFSAWLLDQGFKEVYQLQGGILKYLEEVPQSDSTWQGECYVFDERVAVGHGLIPSATASLCQACGHALTPEDRKHLDYRDAISCPHCAS